MSFFSTAAGLRKAMAACVALIVVCIAENSFFGANSGGAKHDVSVAFFLVSVLAVVALIALAGAAVMQRRRGQTI